jgi:hypothetical protein
MEEENDAIGGSLLQRLLALALIFAIFTILSLQTVQITYYGICKALGGLYVNQLEKSKPTLYDIADDLRYTKTHELYFETFY